MMAKVLSGWLGLGAVLTAGVAAGIVLKHPFRIDEASDLGIAYAVLGGWLAVQLVLGMFVVADAVRLTRRRELAALQRAADGVKLAAIPFFLMNFVALAGAVVIQGAGDRDRLGLDGFLVALLFVVLTYLALLPTSAYGVGCLVVMRKDEQVGPVFFGINATLHFLFVVDVLSSIVVVGLTLLPVVVTRGLILFAGPAGLAFVGVFTATGLVPTVIGTYLMLLPTSIYGVTCLALMMRQRAVSPRYGVVNMLLHLFFVADIVSALAVFSGGRRQAAATAR